MVIFATPQESGDEAYIHAINLKVRVIVGANRYKACMFAKKHFDINTIVLDDGFQHRKLYRNRDIVLIDSTNPFGSEESSSFRTFKGRISRKLLKEPGEFIITNLIWLRSGN